VIFDGTTPAEEYIKHFRFGHTAVKIVPSKSGLERFYATLVESDIGLMAQVPINSTLSSSTNLTVLKGTTPF